MTPEQRERLREAARWHEEQFRRRRNYNNRVAAQTARGAKDLSEERFRLAASILRQVAEAEVVIVKYEGCEHEFKPPYYGTRHCPSCGAKPPISLIPLPTLEES